MEQYPRMAKLIGRYLIPLGSYIEDEPETESFTNFCQDQVSAFVYEIVEWFAEDNPHFSDQLFMSAMFAALDEQLEEWEEWAEKTWT